jgi:hypothetical protein
MRFSFIFGLIFVFFELSRANISKECMEIVKKDIPPKEMLAQVDEFIKKDEFPFTYP